MSQIITPSKRAEVSGILSWYVDQIYGQVEGSKIPPFYCDPVKVGLAAVDPEALARADEAALFKLFVSLAMYQARRDVLIQSQQRSWSQAEATALLSLPSLKRRLARCPCPHLAVNRQFEQACTVVKEAKLIICDHPTLACPVRLAGSVWGRMADLGKLPTSAFRLVWAKGGTAGLLQQALHESDPTLRLEWVVQFFSKVHCVGRKLATLFVSALSTPALAQGLTPWWPALNGNLAVVLDSHATRAVDHLSEGKAGKSYQSRVIWLRRLSEDFDLKRFHGEFPNLSPRLVQQALYCFCSKSNRQVWGKLCALDERGRCPSQLCPICRLP